MRRDGDFKALFNRGGFSPLSMFDGGVAGAWYDPSDFSSMFQTGTRAAPGAAAVVDSPVGCLLDKSGNQNDLTQGTAAARPILRATAGVAPYYLEFDGIDDFLAGTIATAGMGGNISKTMFAAVRAATNTQTLIHYGVAVAIFGFGLRRSTGKRQVLQFGGDLDSTSAATANDEVWTGIKNGNLISIRTDQALDGGPTDLGVATINSSSFIIGKRQDNVEFWAGRLHGLIFIAGNPLTTQPISFLGSKQGRAI